VRFLHQFNLVTSKSLIFLTLKPIHTNFTQLIQAICKFINYLHPTSHFQVIIPFSPIRIT